MAFLPDIHGPDDVKKLTAKQCGELAGEIRRVIIDTVSQQGGHLASNLGDIELTIALHRAFESPKDKLIFDVGHQIYTHKLLTGRFERFHTLRSYHGLSGFPSQAESAHDLFDTGHSSTSISMALGMARARDLRGEDYAVVAVIGDGALTGGMAYEALNDAGSGKSKIIVILNDNEMSISKNVGALSNYLKRLRASASWYGSKRRIRKRIARIPLIGEPLARSIEAARDIVKSAAVAEGKLFEAYGFRYLGPFDGHNIEEMTRVFTDAKQVEGPVLIHVVTQKGRGYELAENEPEKYHGVAPFCVENGLRRKMPVKETAAQAAGRGLVNLAQKDERVIAITAAMAAGTGLTDFAEKFPSRFFDVGIAEQHAVSVASGLAKNGMRPYFAVYATFLQRAYDQIVHDVALQNLPVCILADHAGLVGDDGKTHHGVLTVPMLLSIPNLTIFAPRDTQAIIEAQESALALDGPSVILYPKDGIEPYGHTEGVTCCPGKWERLRSGDDVTILAYGRMTRHTLLAAGLLDDQGIHAGVVDCSSIKPMDMELLLNLANSGTPLVVVEEGQKISGLGSEISRVLVSKGLQTPMMLLGIDDRYVMHGAMSLLLRECGLMPEQIAEEIAAALQKQEKQNG